MRSNYELLNLLKEEYQSNIDDNTYRGLCHSVRTLFTSENITEKESMRLHDLIRADVTRYLLHSNKYENHVYYDVVENTDLRFRQLDKMIQEWAPTPQYKLWKIVQQEFLTPTLVNEEIGRNANKYPGICSVLFKLWLHGRLNDEDNDLLKDEILEYQIDQNKVDDFLWPAFAQRPRIKFLEQLIKKHENNE